MESFSAIRNEFNKLITMFILKLLNKHIRLLTFKPSRFLKMQILPIDNSNDPCLVFMNELMQFWMNSSTTQHQTIQQLKLIYDTTMIFNFHTSICLTFKWSHKKKFTFNHLPMSFAPQKNDENKQHEYEDEMTEKN